jgi:2-(3-amino-3-carboxypropyl)histidine synthase
LNDVEVVVPIERVEAWVDEVRPRRVLIQAPLGLRQIIPLIVDALSKRGVEAFVSMSATWGGCDVAVREAEEIGADGIIHFGHTQFLASHPLPVLFIEAWYSDAEPLLRLASRVVETLSGYSSVGLGSTAQWTIHLPKFAEELKRAGFRILIGRRGARAAHEGQVLGCDDSSLKSIEEIVDCFVVVGSMFHALGLALTSPKPVLAVDPESQRLEWMEETARKVYSQRYASIVKFREARRIGVIVSVKPGQMHIGLARKLRDLLRQHGYEADILVTDEVSETLLMEGRYDAYVNTACPRLSVEDQARFSKPLLLPSEVLVAVGRLGWEEIIKNELFLSLSLPQKIIKNED